MAATADVLELALHDRPALDELGDPLHQQKREAERHQEFRWINRQAASVCRLLILQQRPPEEGPGRVHHHEADRDQEESVTDKVDPIAHALRQHAGNNVDPNVFVGDQRPRRAQQKNRTEQDPLQFEPGIRRDRKHLADDRIHGTDDHRHKNRPCDRLSDRRIEGIDSAAEPQQSLHPRPLLLKRRIPKPAALSYCRLDSDSYSKPAIIETQNKVGAEDLCANRRAQ